MSIRTIQIQRVLQDVVRALYGTGTRPTLNAIQKELSSYFSQYPAGRPLPLSTNFVTPAGRADVATYNQILAHIVANIGVLYEANLEQVDVMLSLTSVLRAKLDRLEAKRNRIGTVIDDYLLSLYNTDGYFFSVGDTFSTVQLVDLDLTSAFIDTTIGAVVLPTVSSLTKHLPGSQMTQSSTAVGTADQTGKITVNFPYKVLSAFSGATDGLTNTFWGIEVETGQPQEVVCVVVIGLGDVNNVVSLSRVDLDPHGISPVQAFVETANVRGNQPSFQSFGTLVQTSINKMSFLDTLRDADTLRITLRKTQPDYTDQSTGTVRYRYIFGAKEISVVQNVYDSVATFISQPLSIADALQSDQVIDAVSLTVQDTVPPDTSIQYFVAQDNGEGATSINEFDWSPIKPVGTSDNPLDTVVRYNGVEQFVRNITANPTGNDLQLIALDSTNPDLSQRNPTPSIIAGVDTYRICQFDDDFVTNSLNLQEGVNTTRIWYKNLSDGVTAGLGYWAGLINGPQPPPTRYGKIDNGQAFFNGADVGESGKSVYVETYLNMIDDTPQPYLAQFLKADPNSKLWNVAVYLDGRLVGSLPVGTDSVLIPWTFKQGLNHVSVLADIPLPTPAAPYPYLGGVKLFDRGNLFDLGTVLLANWDYVSFFDMRYNIQDNTATKFTIQNGQIITRRKPTTDFRLQYAKPTQLAPSGVRVRADFSRNINNPYVGPRLDEYRLRFSYGQAQL